MASTCLTRHANGRDWWLIIPHHVKNVYHTYLIDKNGFTQYPDQILGISYPYDWGSSKEAYFSEDGSKLVVTSPQRYIFMDFDRCTGILSNYIEISGMCTWYSWQQTIPAGHLWFPTALSSNNRFLYVVNVYGIDLNSLTGDESLTNNKLYQYDLQASDIPNSRQEVMGYGVNTGFIGSPHLSSNGLLLLDYGNLGFGTTTLNLLKKPNLLGISSEPTQIPYDKYGGYWYPHLPNYRLSYLPGSSCDTLQHVGIAATTEEAAKIKIQPNPTADKVQISASAIMQELSLYNAMGQLVYTAASKGKETELSLAAYPQGVYFLVIKTEGNHIFTEKIVKL